MSIDNIKYLESVFSQALDTYKHSQAPSCNFPLLAAYISKLLLQERKTNLKEKETSYDAIYSQVFRLFGQKEFKHNLHMLISSAWETALQPIVKIFTTAAAKNNINKIAVKIFYDSTYLHTGPQNDFKKPRIGGATIALENETILLPALNSNTYIPKALLFNLPVGTILHSRSEKDWTDAIGTANIEFENSKINDENNVISIKDKGVMS